MLFSVATSCEPHGIAPFRNLAVEQHRLPTKPCDRLFIPQNAYAGKRSLIHCSRVATRLALWGLPSIAATLGVLWTIRRLKSCRHTEPPSG